MSKTHLKTLAVAADHNQHTLSKAQQAFNNLIQQIEKKRGLLADWEAAISRYQQKYSAQLLPLFADLHEKQTAFAFFLDRLSHHKELKKSERKVLSGVIADLAGQVLAARDDAELKALYNKHSRSDYDEEEAASAESMKAMLEGMLGIELGDVADMSSPDELFQRVEAQMQEEWARTNADKAQKPKHKKTAKQLAKEAREQAEEQQVSLSIREVYRKLVSVLHPDREPDAQERERKTALMQRVNSAYEKRNLLQLLELQLELEHIDQTSINSIGEDRLKHYNKVLKEQLAELELEVRHVQGGFVAQFGLDPFERVSPASIMRDLAAEIADIKQVIRDLQKDMHAFEDIKKVKAWLKQARRREDSSDYFDDLPF